MSNTTTNPQKPTAVQTTGHAWDGDLQEFNNPLPRWWLWAFYATVLFAIGYWFVYPAWPVGGSWTKGFASATFSVGGKEQTMRWNTRSELLQDLDSGAGAVRQREYLQKIASADLDQVRQDPKMQDFVRQAGKVLFGTNCAACHGSGGQGVIGQFPALNDDDWLWGGTVDDIRRTLIGGRNGFMPAFREALTPAQADDVAQYVLTLSGIVQPDEAAERGKAIFHGSVGGCYYCHGDAGKGIKSMGAANLSDKIWTLVDVNATTTVADKHALVRSVIWNGVQNRRQMPAFGQRLSDAEIKLLAFYVHQLGGGQ